jgi:hypothetical protein
LKHPEQSDADDSAAPQPFRQMRERYFPSVISLTLERDQDLLRCCVN